MIITASPPPSTGEAIDAAPLGLGLDVGGTATRWALVGRAGNILCEGSVAGLTALLIGNEAGRVRLAATLAGLAQTLGAMGFAATARVVAGFSGYSDDANLRSRLEALVAQVLTIPMQRVHVVSDITLAYLDCFAPGEGYLVYAGTGSIAVGMDPDGQLHRVGGRGSLLDDGGSGYWIAREALQHIWRAEDEAPGCWAQSALARAVFAQIGGQTWTQTREFVYQGSRGQVGELALAVASAAIEGDAVALDILTRAGRELARLAAILVRRHGQRPVALAGRAAQLHPAILSAMQRALVGVAAPQLVELQPHATAARLAARDDPILGTLARV